MWLREAESVVEGWLNSKNEEAKGIVESCFVNWIVKKEEEVA